MFSSFKVTKKASQVVLALLAFAFFSLYCFMVTAEQRKNQTFDETALLDYINSFGWMVEGDCRLEEVIIPQQFNDVYTEYNKLQKQQGFDLSKHCGETVKQYTYHVLNHKSGGENIYLHILVLDGQIIGGDICSTELNGFMEAFK